MINQENIKALNPCKDRFDNFVTHYGNRSFRPAQFLGLKNITHSDKLWVAFRLLPKATVVKIAADIAESVLHLYERKYPNDLRPRHVIEAARSGVNLLEARNAAANAADYAADAAAADYTAAYAGAYDDANAVAAAAYTTAADYTTAYHAASAAYTAADAHADAAANAAAFAANAALSASRAAAYAGAYDDANAVAAAAYTTAADAARAGKEKQEKLIRTIILKYWNKFLTIEPKTDKIKE